MKKVQAAAAVEVQSFEPSRAAAREVGQSGCADARTVRQVQRAQRGAARGGEGLDRAVDPVLQKRAAAQVEVYEARTAALERASERRRREETEKICARLSDPIASSRAAVRLVGQRRGGVRGKDERRGLRLHKTLEDGVVESGRERPTIHGVLKEGIEQIFGERCCECVAAGGSCGGVDGAHAGRL